MNDGHRFRRGAGPRIRRAPALIALVAAIPGCGDPAFDPAPGGRLAVGTWGGQDAGVIVTDSGAHVHIGCTLGDVPVAVVVGEDGRFALDGSYVLRAFPIQFGPSLPARFDGRVRGRRLTLTVAVDDTVLDEMVTLGPVSVEYGRTPDLGPCPICTVPGRRSTAR